MRKIWSTIKLLFARCFGKKIPYVSEQKYFGMEGEDLLSKKILELIPHCRIKNNIIIQTPEGNAEIDCLVLVGSRLFAIEVKRWKGDLVEMDQHMIQRKVDQWTDETHTKQHKSPFKQLGRAIYLLRNQVQSSAWVNPIVFFEDADSVHIESDGVWFADESDLLTYMSFGGKSSPGSSASDLFDRCIASDYLLSKDRENFLLGRISDKSLCFHTEGGRIKRSSILDIKIYHHLLYDELEIQLKNGTKRTTKLDNERLEIDINGRKMVYSFCKIDYIRLG